MILEVALGIVLGVVMLAMGFHALDWILNHGETALLFGIPLGLLVYGLVINSPACIGWSGLLLIGAILLDLWRQHRAKARDRARNQRESQKWHDAWETHKDRR